jgi:hypothetical protein
MSAANWPETGDHLFRAPADAQDILSFRASSNHWDLYTDGYKSAADTLVVYADEFTETQLKLFCPILFLYRHHFELQLKNIIRLWIALNRPHEKLPANHDLGTLWKQCRSALETVWPNGPREDLDAVEECIKEFIELDPSSTRFRYATDRGGTSHLRAVPHFDLMHLRRTVDKLARLLGSCSDAMESYLADLEANYR